MRFRFLLFAFLLLGNLLLSCKPAVQVSDEDIAEAVFRFQIAHCYEADPPKVYFLSFKRDDPSGELMARFKSNSTVRKRSQMGLDYADLESGERGIVLSVEKVIRLSETKFEVEGACIANGLDGYGFIYSVIRERDGSMRVGSRMTWIS